MVARALWHLKPPENNGVKTRDNRDTMVLQKTRWQAAKLLMRCCYPVSSGRTGCGAGWCRQAPITAQTPSHPRTVSHHHQTNTTSLSLLSADDCRPHHNNGLNRLGNLMGNFNIQIIIMTGLEFCILMKDKYWIPTNHVPRRGGELQECRSFSF